MQDQVLDCIARQCTGGKMSSSCLTWQSQAAMGWNDFGTECANDLLELLRLIAGLIDGLIAGLISLLLLLDVHTHVRVHRLVKVNQALQLESRGVQLT